MVAGHLEGGGGGGGGSHNVRLLAEPLGGGKVPSM